MISVVRITGEGFDFSSGQDMPPGIVLSNGQREVIIHLPQEEIRKVIQLYVDMTRQGAIGPEVEPRPAPPAPSDEPKAMDPPAKPQPSMRRTESTRSPYSDPDTGTDSV